jgi:hypothetical protein
MWLLPLRRLRHHDKRLRFGRGKAPRQPPGRQRPDGEREVIEACQRHHHGPHGDRQKGQDSRQPQHRRTHPHRPRRKLRDEDHDHHRERNRRDLRKSIETGLRPDRKAQAQELDDDVLARLEDVADAQKIRQQYQRLRDLLRPPQRRAEGVAQQRLRPAEDNHDDQREHRQHDLDLPDDRKNLPPLPKKRRQVPRAGPCVGLSQGPAYSIA